MIKTSFPEAHPRPRWTCGLSALVFALVSMSTAEAQPCAPYVPPVSEPAHVWVANGDSATATNATAIPPPPSNVRSEYNEAGNGGALTIVEDYRLVRHKRPNQLIQDGSASASYGSKMLQFYGYQWEEGGLDNDRIELILSSGAVEAPNTEKLNFGEWRYLRFAMKIEPGTAWDRPEMIAQVWQPGGGPALTVHVDPYPGNSSLVKVNFLHHDETVFHSENVAVGAWRAFIIAMKPVFAPTCAGDPGPRGAVLIYRYDNPSAALNVSSLDVTAARNYNATNDSTYKMYWGRRPDPEGGVYNGFEIRVGLYRADGANPGLKLNIVDFDGVKLTNSMLCMPGTAAVCQ